MLASEYPRYVSCVIKTSKNVTTQMKLPVWSRARYGLDMPNSKAKMHEENLTIHYRSHELSKFHRSVMLNRPGAVLYNGNSSKYKATFIENLDAVADQLKTEKVRNNLYTCDHEKGERLLGGNAIIDKATVTLDELQMEDTVLMGNAYATRATLSDCIIGRHSNIIGGEHKGLTTYGNVTVYDVNTRYTTLSGDVVISAESNAATLEGYRISADGTVSQDPADPPYDVTDKAWRYAVRYSSENDFSNLDTFCLNNPLHEAKESRSCKCGRVLPLALAGHPVAISYLLNRAGLTEYVPVEYAGMAEEQMLAELEGIYVYANPVCSDTLIIREKGKRTPTSIRNLEDWKNLIRTEYDLEDVQALYKYH